MFRVRFFVLILMAILSLNSPAYADDAILDAAKFICAQISLNPQLQFEQRFSPSFRAAISAERVRQILVSIFQQDGSCQNISVISKDQIKNKTVKIKMKTQTTNQKVKLVVDDQGLISGLMFDGSDKTQEHITDIKTLATAYEKIGPIYSVVLNDLETSSNLISVNENIPIALGSEFKLYILNRLVLDIFEKKYQWSDEIKLDEAQKSFPSGVMQNWPAGKSYSIEQYAGLMISKSDNTATDHLINFIGRVRIEESMRGLNSFLEQTLPFMKTMDLFRVRTLNEDQVNKYMNLGYEQRIEFLSTLEKSTSREDIMKNLKDSPEDIAKIEWFASTQDICRVVQKLYESSKADSKVLNIMSLSVPFVWLEDDADFDYVGYKGGSEPGVMTMTFLLKSKKQKWYCLSMGINNSQRDFDQLQAGDVFHATLDYARTLIH